MKHTETASQHADEAFAEFARALAGLAAHEQIEEQLAQLRKVLLDGARMREEALSGLVGAWRELADLGMSFAAPIAAFQGGDAGRARDIEAQATELLHACDAFAALLAPLPAEAFTHFAELARARLAQRKPFESVRAVYDAWIESSEAVYSRLAHTEAFARAQSRLNQASLRLRAAQIALVESAAGHLGLPTRADVDALQRQVQELREQVGILSGAPRAGVRKRSPARKRKARRR